MIKVIYSKKENAILDVLKIKRYIQRRVKCDIGLN